MSPRVVHSSSFLFLLCFFVFFLFLFLLLDRMYVVALAVRLEILAPLTSAFFVFLLSRRFSVSLHANVPLWWEVFHQFVFLLSRFWYPRLLFSRSAALPPSPCTLHFDSFVEEQSKWYLQAFVFVSLRIIVHVSLSDTLVSPFWLLPFREDGTWFFTRFFDFLQV